MRGLLWGVGLLVLGFGAAQGASIDPLRAAPMPAAPALATSAPTPVATATAGVAVTNAAGVSQITALVNVRLRTGPGLQYRVTGNLAQGEMATVLGKSRGGYWWQVVNPKGGQAVWVSANPALTAPVRTTTTTEGATADAPVLPIVQRLTVAATHISFSPDNSLLALAAVDNSILVYRTADWTLAWTATVTATASGLDFSPDGNVLIAAGEDGNVHAWDAGSGAAIYTLAYGGWAYGPSFDKAGFYMASGARTGLARVVKTASGERVGEYNNDLPVTSLALSPQGPWLATMTAGSWGPVVLSVWDFKTHERRQLVDYTGLPNQSNVAFDPAARYLAAAYTYGGPIHIWQTATWPEIAALETATGTVSSVMFSPDGRKIAGIASTTLMMWGVSDWGLQHTIELGDYTTDASFSPNSRWIGTVGGQGIPPSAPINEGRLWDTGSGQLAARMPHGGQVQGLAFSADGRWVATGSIDGTTVVWSMPQ